jgi:hypothetical protein
MEKHNCDGCHKEIEVHDEYEPEFCCSGQDCCCMGLPINPVFCDECEEKIFSRKPNRED